MAGLLHTIARQLFGPKSTAPTSTSYKTATQKKTTTASKTESKIAPVIEPTIATDTVAKWQPTTTETANSVFHTDVKTNVVDRTIKRERIQTEVAREDYLLNQIDEFRERAQKLQDLLLSKESKAEELQTIVDERESKARELQSILEERQRKADGITAEMNKQIDNLIEKVTAKLTEIEASMSEDFANGQKVSEEQAAQLKEALESVNSQLEVLKGELSEKIHSENVKSYRNVADLFKGLEDKMAKVDVIEAKTKSVHKGVIAVIVLTVINMLGLTAVVLLELGVFNMFFR